MYASRIEKGLRLNVQFLNGIPTTAHCEAERWVCRSILQTQSYKAAIECQAELLTGMRIR